MRNCVKRMLKFHLLFRTSEPRQK